MLVVGCKSTRAAEAVQNQIESLFEHGDLNSAASAADRALTKYRADPVWLWRFRILKAHILVYQSAYKDALTILQDDLPPALIVTDIGVRRSMVQGMAYRVAQEFDRSAQKLDEAEDLASRGQPQLLCEVLNARAALEGSQKKYDKAESAYTRALALARKEGRAYQEAGALVGLAWVATSQERFGEAVDRDQSALRLARSLGMEGLAATALGNLAWSYFELGDFESALEFYKKGADTSERSGLRGYSAYWFTGVANSYVALHDYASAEDLSKRTLGRARTLNNAETVAECLNILAEITLREGRLDEAEKYNQEAKKLEEEGKDHFGVLQSLVLSGRIGTRKHDFAQAEMLLRRASEDANAETALRWEIQARLAELYDAKGLTDKAEQEYHQAIDTIEAARASIAADDLRIGFLSGGIEFYDDYVDFLVAHGRSRDALKVAELCRARTLEEGLGVSAQAEKVALRNFRPEQIARRLKATLLFYWVGEKQSHLWVVAPAKTTHLTLPAANQIDPLVKSYREALLGVRDPLETGDTAGQKLYSMLVEPAKSVISQGPRVILLPDGSLYGLNFETLIVPGPKPHYWIEDVTVTTASSLTLLASAASRPAPREKSMFLVGDTVSPNADFPALPQAGAEMQNVEKYFPEPRRTVLSGSGATPAAYLASNPEQFAYLHFVTHGTASRARPLESAVVLSKEKDEDSYKLYARDIVKRHLSAYLVTISACDGAGTRTFSGEGLVGLSWAFLHAGVHNVIGALWEVSDASTPQLMDSLYDGLSRGQDPAAALRAAKLSLLHSNSVFKKPYYWAPFQLYAGS